MKTLGENRVSIFRAREITLHNQQSVSDVLAKIINADDDGGDTTFDYTIMDTTPATSRKPKRGTAMVYFRGKVPKAFQPLMRDSETVTMTNGGKQELSMEVDASFIDETQLYEPPPGVKVRAE